MLPRREVASLLGCLMLLNDLGRFRQSGDYRTMWTSARFHVGTNLESLSGSLQTGIRFFHVPIPSSS